MQHCEGKGPRGEADIVLSPIPKTPESPNFQMSGRRGFHLPGTRVTTCTA